MQNTWPPYMDLDAEDGEALKTMEQQSLHNWKIT